MITVPEVDFWIMIVSVFLWGMGLKSMLDQLRDMWRQASEPDEDEDAEDYWLDDEISQKY